MPKESCLPYTNVAANVHNSSGCITLCFRDITQMFFREGRKYVFAIPKCFQTWDD